MLHIYFPTFSGAASLRLYPNDDPDLHLNITAAVDSYAHCTTSNIWVSQSFRPQDCLEAMSMLFMAGPARHAGKNYEFLRPGATPQFDLPLQQLPLRYPHGMYTRTFRSAMSPYELFER